MAAFDTHMACTSRRSISDEGGGIGIIHHSAQLLNWLK